MTNTSKKKLKNFILSIDKIHRDIIFLSNEEKRILRGFFMKFKDLYRIIKSRKNVYLSGSFSVKLLLEALGLKINYKPADIDLLFFVNSSKEMIDLLEQMEKLNLINLEEFNIFKKFSILYDSISFAVKKKIRNLNVLSIKIIHYHILQRNFKFFPTDNHFSITFLRNERLNKTFDIFYTSSRIYLVYKYTQTKLYNTKFFLWKWRVPVFYFRKPLLSDFLSLFSVSIPLFHREIKTIKITKNFFNLIFPPNCSIVEKFFFYRYFIKKFINFI